MVIPRDQISAFVSCPCPSITSGAIQLCCVTVSAVKALARGTHRANKTVPLRWLARISPDFSADPQVGEQDRPISRNENVAGFDITLR